MELGQEIGGDMVSSPRILKMRSADEININIWFRFNLFRMELWRIQNNVSVHTAVIL